jgi:hypothetical protein
MLVLSTAAGVQAQDAAPSEPAPAPTTAPAPTPEPAAPAPAAEPEEPPLPRPVAVATPAVEGEAQALPRPVETEPTEEAKAVAAAGGPTYPSLTIAIGARTGLAINLNEGQLSLNDGLVDQVHARPYFSAALVEWFGFDFGLEIGTPKGLGAVAVLDAIAKLKLADEFQIWVGQHIPANDRNNMNGPFYQNGWNFPIGVQSYPFDVGARDRGITAWGLIADGHLKYHASVVDAQPGAEFDELRYAGRLTVHLLEPENFYYNSGTYYGKQDILAIGAVIQYQGGSESTPEGTNLDNEFIGMSVDFMYEQNFDSAGTFTLDGGYWNFNASGDDYAVNQGTNDLGLGVAGPVPGQSFMVGLAWLTPNKVGVGYISPQVRLQYGDYATSTITIDAGIAYVVDGYNHRWHLNYRHVEPEVGEATDLIQIGVQAAAFK